MAGVSGFSRNAAKQRARRLFPAPFWYFPV
jgi:hypothetical protein